VSDAFLISIISAEPTKGEIQFEAKIAYSLFYTDSGGASENANSVDNSTYLVEPFRSSSVVRKFSGTLGATVDSDKLAMTILAFSHFILERTACTMAMVDTQGTS
jgi:hypothetical protein